MHKQRGMINHKIANEGLPGDLQSEQRINDKITAKKGLHILVAIVYKQGGMINQIREVYSPP